MPTRRDLQILGDGNQSKPYIHADDVVAAMLFLQARQTSGYEYYNVGSEDHLLVRDIADIIVGEMGLKNVKYEYTGGARGWRARRSGLPAGHLENSPLGLEEQAELSRSRRRRRALVAW